MQRVLSIRSPKGVLGRSLVSTLPDLVSTHCPRLAQKLALLPLLGLALHAELPAKAWDNP
ncbi:hypothetical protein Taro_017604, partial [Colocasia esculenta]|nr:hypothetical protein [Colocasia esculenta]